MAPDSAKQEKIDQGQGAPAGDAGKGQKAAVKAKYGEVPKGFEEAEKKNKEAMEMVNKELAKVSQQLKDEFKNATNTTPADNLVEDRMKELGQKSMDALLKDPKFPGALNVYGAVTATLSLPGRTWAFGAGTNNIGDKIGVSARILPEKSENFKTAQDLLKSKVGDAAKQIETELSGSKLSGADVKARINKIVSDYVGGLKADPNFPGAQYLRKSEGAVVLSESWGFSISKSGNDLQFEVHGTVPAGG